MKSFGVFVTLSLCLGLALATPQWVQMEGHQVDPNYAVTFKIAMKPQNLEYLDSLFWQISDSDSPLFGKFLTNDQIADLISLPDEDIEKVESYLAEKSGEICSVLNKRSVHRDYILVSTCAGQAEKIFPNLHLAAYQKEGTDSTILRSAVLMDISQNLTLLGVPADLHQYIEGVHELTDTPIHMTSAAKIDPSIPWLKSDKQLSISEIIGRFGADDEGLSLDLLASDNGQVRQSVVEFDHAGFSPAELEAFQEKYGVPIDPVKNFVGTQILDEDNLDYVEASLDVQTITSIAQGAQTWDFVFDAAATFVDVVETIMTTEGAPMVYSCSWGGLESQFTQAKIDAVDAAFMKLGLAGHTFLIASGDSGPTLNPDECSIFDAQYPATSSYILSVGGTKVTAATNVEGAWFRGSGGFSNFIDRPAYQESHVQHYLENTTLPPNPNGSRYTTAGRAYPDVSAFGAFYPIGVYGSFPAMGAGTSAATPQFSGILTLINIHRFKNGLGPLGPINQTLYKLKEGVGFDVIEGQNYAISEIACQGQYLPGFKAAPGWDPATGLGSPRFDVLLRQLLEVGAPKKN